MAADGLSINAIRLLGVLRREGATCPAAALTDSELARLTFLPRRQIIDAAGELLAGGYLVLAGPHGRWLGDEESARRYERSLRFRALKILVRRRNLRRAMDRHRRGQLAFPGIAP